MRGFEFGARPFPFFVELVDFLLVVVHVFRDGGDGVPVTGFRCGYEFCLEFAAQGFCLCNIFFDFRKLLFERLYDLAAFGDIVGACLAVFLGAGRSAGILVPAVRFYVDVRNLDVRGFAPAGLLFGCPAHLLEEVGVGALEDAALAAVEYHEPCRERVQQFLVVGDDHRRAFVIVERVDEALDGFHVEVVRRFVEQQHVAGARKYFSEQNTAALATAQDLHLLECGIATEHHEARKPARAALLRYFFDGRCDFFFDVVFEIQAVDIRLPEIVYL